MCALRAARSELDTLIPYDAKEVKADIIMSANENPYNMPRELQERISSHLNRFAFNRYPDATAPRLRKLIAEANGLDIDNVLIANGGDEIIMNLFLTWGGKGRKFMNFPPTFAMYENDAQVTGTEVISIPRRSDFKLDQDAIMKRLAKGDIDLIIITNPNNPSGNLVDEAFLMEMLKATDALVCVDEAYFEFSRATVRPLLERFDNLVILRTFSKAFSLAALRVGYMIASPEIVRTFKKVRQPYSVSAFSQWAAQVVYRDRALFENAIEEIVFERGKLIDEMRALKGVTVFDSESNFILFKVAHASRVWRELLHEYSILIRDVSREEGLEDCLRVSVGTPAQNEAFLAALRSIVQGGDHE